MLRGRSVKTQLLLAARLSTRRRASEKRQITCTAFIHAIYASSCLTSWFTAIVSLICPIPNTVNKVQVGGSLFSARMPLSLSPHTFRQQKQLVNSHTGGCWGGNKSCSRVLGWVHCWIWIQICSWIARQVVLIVRVASDRAEYDGGWAPLYRWLRR